MEAIIEYIQPFVIPGLVVVCYIIGWGLKSVWESFNNKLIPLVLMPIGIVGALWLHGWVVEPSTIFAGMSSAALAVWVHDTGKHLGEFIKEQKAKPPEQ